MIHFEVLGEPATKKTGQRIFRHGKRIRVVPSERTLTWTAAAQVFMRKAMKGHPPFEGPVKVDYVFYRRKDVADLGGLEAALDDAMQGIVIANDRQIKARTSHIVIDRATPRVRGYVTVLDKVPEDAACE